MSDKKNSLLKNASIYIGLAFIQKSIPFLLIPFYTHFLSPSEFGLVNQTISLGSIYILILTYALNEAAARFYFEYRKNKHKQKIAVGVIVILSTMFVVFGTLLILVFNKYTYYIFIPEIPKSFIYFGCIILFTSPIYYIYQKILRIKEDAKNYMIMTLGYTFTQILLSVIFIWVMKFGSFGYLLALSLTSLVFGFSCYIKLKSEMKFKFNKALAFESLRYSTSIVPHTVSSWGLRGFTIVALGRLLNSTLVGIFNSVNFLPVIINVFSKAILDAYQPWVYEKIELGNSGFRDVISSARLIGIFFVVLGFLFSLFSKEIILLLIDYRYHSGIYIAPILIYSSVILVMGSLLVFVLYFYKNTAKFVGISTIIGSFVNIILCIKLIPMYGILGGAISLAFANFTISTLKQYFASKTLKKNVLFVDLYFFATLNLILSFLFIKYNFCISNKLGVFIAELIILSLIYRNSIRGLVSSFCYGKKALY